MKYTTSILIIVIILHSCVLLDGVSSKKVVQFGDLPNSNIRTKISKLKGDSFNKAMGFLNRINFNAADASIYDVDNSGGVYAIDSKLPPEEDVQSNDNNDIKRRLSYHSYEPLALNPPILHSNALATNKVWLNFGGYTIASTAWNSGRVDPLIAKPFSTDDDYTTFSSSEQAIIEDVWKRMSEDFLPFNVDVTTEKPATLGPNTAHVLFTENFDANGNAMPSSGAGGVAYIGVYGASYLQYYSPALVYSNNLSNRSFWMSEAGSHELGHNMGLSHDGSSTTTYYGGHGTGAVTWGPIMGNSYSKYVTQFSKGEYPNANQFEDDIAILTTKMGIRNDDHGNINADATLLTTNGNVGTSNGIIETSTDIDVFRFEHGSVANIEVSVFSFRSGTAYSGGNLDPKIVLQDSNGNVISPTTGETDPQIGTNVVVTFSNQPAGTYYVHVSASGVENSYSTYGSLGYYDISVSYSAAVDSEAPTFTNFVASNITAGGSASHQIIITYSDDIAISVTSLADTNIKVTRDSDSTIMQVFYESVNINSNGTPRQVIYSVDAPAPNNVFDIDDNALYTVEILSNQVSDTSGNYIAAGTIGTFTVSVQPDTIAPEMIVSQPPNDILDDTTNPQFQLRFTDNSLVSVSTIDNNDIKVTGPGYTGFAQIVSKSPTIDSSSIDVTFEIVTTFTADLNGNYDIILVGSIQDVEGNSVVQNNNAIATLSVNIPVVVETNLIFETMETEPFSWLFGNGWFHGLMSGPNVNAASNTLTVDGKYDEDVGERILQSESFNAETYNQIVFEFDRMLDLGNDDVARVAVVVDGVENNLWVNNGGVKDSSFVKQQFDLSTLCAGKTNNYIIWVLGPTVSTNKRRQQPTDGFGWAIRNIVVKGTKNVDPDIPYASALATDVGLPISTLDIFVEYYSTYGFEESVICGATSPIQVVGARSLPNPVCAPEGSSAIDSNVNNRRVRYILTLEPSFGYEDNGKYSIVLNPDQVLDKNSVFISGGGKGSFIVDVAIPTNTIWEYDFEVANSQLSNGWTYTCSEWTVGTPSSSTEPNDRRSLFFADGDYDDSDPNKVCTVLSPVFSNSNPEYNAFEAIITYQLGIESDDNADIFYKCDGGSNTVLFSNGGSKIQTSTWSDFRADQSSNFVLPLSTNCQIGIKIGPFSQQSSSRGKKTVTTATTSWGWNIAKINVIGMTTSNSEVVTPTPSPTSPPTYPSSKSTISVGVAAGVLVGLLVFVVIGFVIVGRRKPEQPIYTISAPVSGGQITLTRALGHNVVAGSNTGQHRRRTSSFNGDEELELPRLSVFENTNTQQVRRSISGNNLPVPPNWFRLVDESGIPFYWNEKTGISQWERPKVRLEDDTITEETSQEFV